MKPFIAKLTQAIVVLMLVGMSLPAAEVAATQGESITIKLGSSDGVLVGMTGRLTTRQSVSGTVKSFEIARFEITAVEPSRSTATLTQVGAGWTVEPGMDLAFDQVLSQPVADTGTIIIRSNISGDTAILDGRRLGPTPQTLEVSPGTYTVRVEKDGYEPAEQQVMVAVGEQAVVRLTLTAVSTLPMNPVVLLRQANAAWDRHDWHQAALLYGELLKQAPDNPIAKQRRTEAQQKVDDARRAREAEESRRLAEQRQREEELQRQRADEEQRKKDLAQVPLWRETAKMLLESGDRVQAAGYLSKISRVASDDPYLQSVASSEIRAAETLLVSGDYGGVLAKVDLISAAGAMDQARQLTDKARTGQARMEAEAPLANLEVALDSGDVSEIARLVTRFKNAEIPGDLEPRVAAVEKRLDRIRQVPSSPSAGDLWVDPMTGIRLRFIPAGEFLMGTTEAEMKTLPKKKARRSDEDPHAVTRTRGYWMTETEVTQGQWAAVLGENPSIFKDCGSDCPVESVSWYDAVKYANALSRRAGDEECYRISGERVTFKGLGCEGYRLPTESEWEYAARAGGRHRYSGSDEIGQLAWYWDNSGQKTHRVGTNRANAWGLYDMTGNVWEWCWDWYGAYPSGIVTDPTGPSSGSYRVTRGGGWDGFAGSCRSANRYNGVPGNSVNNLGFRLVRTAAE